jgi:hypothetical protein
MLLEPGVKTVQPVQVVQSVGERGLRGSSFTIRVGFANGLDTLNFLPRMPLR